MECELRNFPESLTDFKNKTECGSWTPPCMLKNRHSDCGKANVPAGVCPMVLRFYLNRFFIFWGAPSSGAFWR